MDTTAHHNASNTFDTFNQKISEIIIINDNQRFI